MWGPCTDPQNNASAIANASTSGNSQPLPPSTSEPSPPPSSLSGHRMLPSSSVSAPWQQRSADIAMSIASGATPSATSGTISTARNSSTPSTEAFNGIGNNNSHMPVLPSLPSLKASGLLDVWVDEHEPNGPTPVPPVGVPSHSSVRSTSGGSNSQSVLSKTSTPPPLTFFHSQQASYQLQSQAPPSLLSQGYIHSNPVNSSTLPASYSRSHPLATPPALSHSYYDSHSSAPSHSRR